MAYFGKEFSLVKQEKFDELVNTFEIPQELKDKIVNSKSTAKIVKNGDTYTLTSISAKGPKDTTFKIGEEIEDNLLDMVKVKFVFTVDGDTFTQVIKAGDKQLVVKRTFSDNELVVTMTGSGFAGEAKRYYKA